MKVFDFKKFREYAIFIWLIIITLILVLSSLIFTQSAIDQNNRLKESLKNTYLKKTFIEITNNLKPRYSEIAYVSKSGDNYQTIINNINISNEEKKLVLNSILNVESLKILRINQKFLFKIDNLLDQKIIELRIETDKKNEVVFFRSEKENKLNSKKIEKNFTRKLVYKETVITDSLYNSAVNLDIKPNIIIEFARLYGFQVDFQRDVRKNDKFQILYEIYLNENNTIVETGEILFANLELSGQDNSLYHFDKEGSEGHYDKNGKSVKKALMKTPINGARLSSPFGMRKHPIDGFNKMHRGTDFAAPSGTPIMASGSGTVTRARWCGGGGNCVKIKHNSTYETIYAHMKSFARGIKEGRKVKQGQIIGYVGSTGMSTGPHLHYEVIVNGKKVNSQTLKLPSGKVLKDEERKQFEIHRIKTDVMIAELIAKKN